MTQTRKTGARYAEAGVDVEAGYDLVRRIAPMAEATARAGVVSGLGGFGALFDLKAAGYRDPILVAATDGVGTKLRIAIDTGRLGGVGVDLVAMCVNDLVCQGAEPLIFLDYFATGRLDPASAAEVIAGVAEGCSRAGCALVGGETAEMPGMYAAGDFDLAGFAVGALERGTALPLAPRAGDVLLGLASDGVHSNGFSLVRRLVAEAGLDWSAACPWPDAAAATLGEALLVPTRIYVRPVLEAIRAGGVRGVAHITGGGLVENVPRALDAGHGAEIDLAAWSWPAVFGWLAERGGLGRAAMAEIFNCGIGMVLVVDPARAEALSAELTAAGERVARIGRVTAGQGVRFRSGAAGE